MDFRTLVELPKRPPLLTPRSHIFFMGSCFAENMGKLMLQTFPAKQISINPFGVLYNPESLRHALEILLYGSLFFPHEFMFKGRSRMWHSWLHSGVFSAAAEDECAKNILVAYNNASALLRKAEMLCVTFGTNHVYELKTGGFIVGNCHKEPADLFKEYALNVCDIVASWSRLLEDMRREYPRLHIVFTISPYRYAKYGMHRNQVAKSTLLLAVDQLCREHENAVYFPAYEIVNDELRDYRFYQEDMLHPTEQAAKYIWERFKEWSFSEETKEFCEEYQRIRKDESHKILCPNSPEAVEFERKKALRKEKFMKKWKCSL